MAILFPVYSTSFASKSILLFPNYPILHSIHRILSTSKNSSVQSQEKFQIINTIPRLFSYSISSIQSYILLTVQIATQLRTYPNSFSPVSYSKKFIFPNCIHHFLFYSYLLDTQESRISAVQLEEQFAARWIVSLTTLGVDIVARILQSKCRWRGIGSADKHAQGVAPGA